MQKLFRSLIAVGGLAGLAACGDDVSVTEPPPPPFTVSGAPVTAIQVGAKVQLQASEAATWASSAANVASVDGTGLVTAVAAGTASITATSTADVNRKASVTITVTAPAVRSITVSPNAVTLNPGGTQGFVANVDADPGVDRAVTWASSNTAAVTITAAGVATAVAPGVATITATSVAAPSVLGAASVTVRTPTSARVSIQKVTVGCPAPGCGLNTPVNLAATAGQIDVTIDVDPGDFVAQKVDLLVDGVVVGSQNFTAAQSMEMTNAHAFENIENAVASTVISFNTAAFNPTTGAVAAINLNGPHILSARLTVVGGGAGGSAAPTLPITFANANTWVSTLAFTGTTAQATGTGGTAAGLAFRRGGLTVTVLPVIYNAGQSVVAAGSFVNFGSATCDALTTVVPAVTGAGTRQVPLTGTGPFTAAFPQATSSSVATANSVANYEFNTTNPTCLTLAPNGEVPTLTAVDNNGNSIMVAALPTVATGIRLDNRAPGHGASSVLPAFGANPNGRASGWINDAVGLNGSNTSSTDNDWIINGSADQGIGGGSTSGAAYQRWLRIAAATGGLVDDARAATASDAAVLPAPTVASTSMCAIVTARDQLGNESSLPSAGTTCLTAPAGPGLSNTASTHLKFGVDIDEPTIAYDASSVADGARLNGATFGTEFVVTVADGGTIGVSGMLAGSPVRASVIRREADGTNFTPTGATSDCVVGALGSSNTVCNLGTLLNTGAAGLSVALPLVSTLVAPQTIDGYYTFTSRAFDAAGNFIDIAAPRVAVHDDTPPSLTTALFNVPLNGPTVVFNANASDNLDLWKVQYDLTYAGAGLPANIRFPATQLNSFNNATLANSNVAAGVTLNGFMRQIELVTGNAPLATGGGFKPSGILGDVFDQGGNTQAGGQVLTNIPGASVTNGVLFTAAAAPLLTRSWSITAPAAVNVSANNTTNCGPVTPSTATSVTLTADATGPTATYNAPFSRVDFYVLDPISGLLVQIGTGQQQPIFDDGSAFGRRHRWNLVWTPGDTYGCNVANINVYAFGVSAAGDGLVSPVFTNVSIVP